MAPNGSLGGGGGGGGAILIASSTLLEFGSAALIRAIGGSGSTIASGGQIYNGGSGGAIRLVAPRVVAASGASLNVSPAGTDARIGGAGRIRIDALDYRSANFTITGPAPPSVASFGKVLIVFPDQISRLSILRAAGRDIPEGTNSPVVVLLPSGSDTNQVVRVQARDFVGTVPIEVVVTPENGPSRIYPAEINMASGSPAFTDVQVVVPVNTEAAIHAWTR
jgi:hypothetical protein